MVNPWKPTVTYTLTLNSIPSSVSGYWLEDSRLAQRSYQVHAYYPVIRQHTDSRIKQWQMAALYFNNRILGVNIHILKFNVLLFCVHVVLKIYARFVIDWYSLRWNVFRSLSVSPLQWFIFCCIFAFFYYNLTRFMCWGERIEINCNVTCPLSGDNPLVQSISRIMYFLNMNSFKK